MLRLAEEKLAPGRPGREEDDHLAVLAQRFCIDIFFNHKEASSYVETAVASHGRICLSTTEDRAWSFTTYPSEPFLSCAAARIFHKSSVYQKKVLTTLMKKVRSGLIDIGKTGELANRLIWLIAKDNYVRKTQVLTVPSLVSEEFADCRRIPVIGFLEHVFGDSFWSTIGEGRGEEVKAEFNDAYINFSHWVSMKSIMGNRDIIR